ncbi:hypothetical protein SESBI_11672 [Sesbania bispinosa]|nr:hypothetical protein SESBI_11672 [Sesbania bispinosa]
MNTKEGKKKNVLPGKKEEGYGACGREDWNELGEKKNLGDKNLRDSKLDSVFHCYQKFFPG